MSCEANIGHQRKRKHFMLYDVLLANCNLCFTGYNQDTVTDRSGYSHYRTTDQSGQSTAR